MAKGTGLIMAKTGVKSVTGRLAIAAVVVPLALGGCTSIKDTRGYIVDQALTTSIQPGIDNKQSVEGTLGHPSFASEFGAPVWYYVSTTSEQRIFGQPKIAKHQVMKVAFDSAGTVSTVETTGKEAVVDINPDGDKTPTLGRDRSFFEDLFGNIGAVGAPGAGPAGSPGGGPNGT